jgi:hypothetical protein
MRCALEVAIKRFQVAPGIVGLRGGFVLDSHPEIRNLAEPAAAIL